MQAQLKEQPIWKWMKIMSRHFTEEYIHMAHEHIKRCSVCLTIREMQMKSTMRYYYAAIRRAKTENSENLNFSEDAENVWTTDCGANEK